MALQSSIVDTVTLPLTVHLSTLVFPIPHKLVGKPDKMVFGLVCVGLASNQNPNFFMQKK